MKLPDFALHAGFNDLRKKMGAELIELAQEKPGWERLFIQLAQEGIDVTFDEVEIQPDGTFEYRGQKVIVYIRDQSASALANGREYKFHVAQCDTLDRMHRANLSNRYVVTNRKDGLFVVNVIRGSGAAFSTVEKRMHVCKHCISALGLINESTRRFTTPAQFSIEEFFRKYSSKISRMPQHTEKTAPVNIYPDNWREIANKLKMENDWLCEECSRSFKQEKGLLHVHHIDGDKSNNRDSNLKVLCVACHGEQPGHEHMKATPNYKSQASKRFRRSPDAKSIKSNWHMKRPEKTEMKEYEQEKGSAKFATERDEIETGAGEAANEDKLSLSEITDTDLAAETGLTRNHISMLVMQGVLPIGRKDGKFRYLPREECLLILAGRKD